MRCPFAPRKIGPVVRSSMLGEQPKVGRVADEGVAGVTGQEPGDRCAFGEVERVVDSDELGGNTVVAVWPPWDPSPQGPGIKASTSSSPARDGPECTGKVADFGVSCASLLGRRRRWPLRSSSWVRPTSSAPVTRCHPSPTAVRAAQPRRRARGCTNRSSPPVPCTSVSCVSDQRAAGCRSLRRRTSGRTRRTTGTSDERRRSHDADDRCETASS